MKKKSIGLHIFRRNLRIEDNVSLNSALKECEEVICVFIFDSRQKKHDYVSYNGFDFMLESLEDLRTQLEKEGGRLLILTGELTNILNNKKCRPTKQFGTNCGLCGKTAEAIWQIIRWKNPQAT